MEIDIVGALEHLKELVEKKKKRVEGGSVGDRQYLLDQETGEVTEVLPRFEDIGEHAPPVRSIVGIESLIAWGKSFPGEPGEVCLSRCGESEARWPRLVTKGKSRDTARMDFFDDFLPPDQWMGADTFFTWLDRIRGGISDFADKDGVSEREMIDLAFGQLTATTSTVTSIEMKGGVMVADVKRGEKVEGNRKIPRRVTSHIPFGDPAFVTPVTFIVTVKLDTREKDLRFRAVHDQFDGAIDRFTEWAYDELVEALPNWTVIVTR